MPTKDMMKRVVLALFVALAAILIWSHAMLTGRVDILTQLVIAGILNGGLYALIAAGMALVFGVMKVINLAHGAFIILGSYVSFWLFTLYGINPFLSIAIAFLLLLLMGFAVQRYLIERLMPYGPDPPLLVTFGLLLTLHYAMIFLWKADVRSIDFYLGSASFGGLIVEYRLLLIFSFGVLTLLILHQFLKKTYLGKAVRAVAMDRNVASLMGINVKTVNAVSFAIGTGLAGVAGPLIAVSFGFEPASGTYYTILAFLVVVLGGIGSISGTLIAGLVIGLVMGVGTYFLGQGVRELIILIIFLLTLILKPTGLLAKFRTF